MPVCASNCQALRQSCQFFRVFTRKLLQETGNTVRSRRPTPYCQENTHAQAHAIAPLIGETISLGFPFW